MRGEAISFSTAMWSRRARSGPAAKLLWIGEDVAAVEMDLALVRILQSGDGACHRFPHRQLPSGDGDAEDLPVDVDRSAEARLSGLDWLEELSVHPAHKELQGAVGSLGPDLQWLRRGIDSDSVLVDQKSHSEKEFAFHASMIGMRRM
jgi:hypothetical protein